MPILVCLDAVVTDPNVSPSCACVLCDPAASATFRARQRQRKYWSRETAHVREHGWHVVGVGGQDIPDWAFTVGLWHSYRIPEVAMFGLELQGLMHWVNAGAAELRDGAATEPGTLLAGVIEGYEVQVQPVHVSWHRPLLGTAVGFYGQTSVPVVQHRVRVPPSVLRAPLRGPDAPELGEEEYGHQRRSPTPVVV